MVELKIDPEFARAIPEMANDEYECLKEQIISEGKILDSIKTWNGLIVDGHHRYKIAKEHPEISFNVTEMDFPDRDNALIWIYGNQVGRRNISEMQKRILIGRKYELEKKARGFAENKYTLANKGMMVRSEQNQNLHGTRSRIAKEAGVSDAYVQRSSTFVRGLDAAAEVGADIEHDLVSGKMKATIEEVANLAKMPAEERKIAVEALKMPPKMRKIDSDNKVVKQEITVKEPVKKAEDIQEEAELEDESPIEDSLMVTYDGIINTFIATSDNLLARFPKLKSELKYRKQILDMLEKGQNYITETQSYLNDED